MTMAAPYISAPPAELAAAQREYDAWLTETEGKRFGSDGRGPGRPRVANPVPKYKRVEFPLGPRDLARACVKISDVTALEIVDLYESGEWSQRALARRYDVAQTTISYLLKQMSAPKENAV